MMAYENMYLLCGNIQAAVTAVGGSDGETFLSPFPAAANFSLIAAIRGREGEDELPPSWDPIDQPDPVTPLDTTRARRSNHSASSKRCLSLLLVIHGPARNNPSSLEKYVGFYHVKISLLCVKYCLSFYSSTLSQFLACEPPIT